MRASSLRLKKGMRIDVEVAEVLSAVALIVAFEGRLFRVGNETGEVFKLEQRLALLVISEHPLKFRIESRNQARFERFA